MHAFIFISNLHIAFCFEFCMLLSMCSLLSTTVLMQEDKMQQLVLNWNSRTSQLLAPVVSGMVVNTVYACTYNVIHLHIILE